MYIALYILGTLLIAAGCIGYAHTTKTNKDKMD